MNILLIYPEFPDTFWSFKHALEFVRKKASLPPLDLLTVAAMLPPEEGRRLGITEKGKGYGKPNHMSSLWKNNI